MFFAAKRAKIGYSSQRNLQSDLPVSTVNSKRETQQKESPLASRMRPKTLDEVVGQKHIIGKNTMLYRAIKADKLSSVIFYGPPGTGKTTLAMVIANTTSSEFTQLNATVAGKKDMEDIVKRAKDLQGMYGRRTILFIDEIQTHILR